MKRILTYALGLLLFAGLSYAVAQNVTRSVQLSQDPSGPIGYDNLNGVYFPGKLYNSNNQTAPTAASCGTSPTLTGTSTGGSVVEGTGTVTTCTVVFAAAYPATPYCFGQSSGSATPVGASATPNGVVFSHVASAAAMKINYFCMGQQP